MNKVNASIAAKGRVAELIALLGDSRASEVTKRTSKQLKRYISGESEPTFETVRRLAAAAGRSLDWVSGGEDIFVPAASSAISDFVLIPHFEVQAGAGPGRLSVREPSTPYDEPAGGEVIAFREDWLRKKGINPHTAHVLTAVGDSMEPTIRDGDLLLVDRAIDRVRDLGLYVVTWGGFVMVKRVELRRDGTLVLKSDNRQYAEVLVGPDEIESLAVEGRVRWIARTT